MAAGEVVSIQIGQVEQLGSEEAETVHEKPWTTAFFKRPIVGSIAVGPMGLDGDEVADRKNHGGLDKAVLCYSADHVGAWEAELPDLNSEPGAFGENLTIRGLCEATVCIGDVWTNGEVQFEVSQPRQPCWKLGRRHRQSDLPKRVVKNGRSGWYVRVLTAGVIESGDRFELVERRHPDWTIAAANSTLYRKDASLASIRGLAAVPQLAAAWREALGDLR